MIYQHLSGQLYQSLKEKKPLVYLYRFGNPQNLATEVYSQNSPFSYWRQTRKYNLCNVPWDNFHMSDNSQCKSLPGQTDFMQHHLHCALSLNLSLGASQNIALCTFPRLTSLWKRSIVCDYYSNIYYSNKKQWKSKLSKQLYSIGVWKACDPCAEVAMPMHANMMWKAIGRL